MSDKVKLKTKNMKLGKEEQFKLSKTVKRIIQKLFTM